VRYQRTVDRPVLAQAFDIRDTNTTLPNDILVDTNAWLSTQYSLFSLPGSRRGSSDYADFFARCFSENCGLIRSAFSLPEIAHVIEVEELRVYNKRHGSALDVKAARYETSFRRKVVAEVLATWAAVSTYSKPSGGIHVTDATVLDIKNRFGQYKLDGYDLFFLQEARETQVRSILTHDFDFLSVPDLRVYTGNSAAVDAARKCGRLRT